MPRFQVPAGFFDESGSYPRVRDLVPRTIERDDPEYPTNLQFVARPPERLYALGRDLRSLGPIVCVIGARRATQYGITVAMRLAADLAVNGVCVASGMARGADAAAHAGALEAGGTTLAVLGCGADLCYPSSSRGLFAEIVGRGAIVSALPPGTEVRREHLVERNWVLIGLADAVVVVQGDEDSAAVRTGGNAVELGTPVFAVPGPIDSAMSRGVHGLLRRNEVQICTGAADVLAALAARDPAIATMARRLPELPPAQLALFTALDDGAASAETLVARAGLGVVDGLRALSALELRGLVRRAGPLIVRGY